MRVIYFLILLGLVSCQEKPAEETTSVHFPSQGEYKGVIHLNDSITLPFVFSVSGEATPVFTFKNGEEEITANDVVVKGDSLLFNMPVFNTGFKCVFNAESITGSFIKYDAEDYVLPFTAMKSENTERFKVIDDACCDISKKWKVTFRPGQDNAYLAIGEFEQEGNHLTGTFMTETGDYRFLEGVVDGHVMKLSAFDGMHLYYFEAEIASDETLNGILFSGKTGFYEWIAERDDSFELRDPEKLTYLKDGYEHIEFELPLTEDSTLIFDQEHFNGKVVILQILGSWCPNCMDESVFLQKLYEYYQDQGLVVIGLAFERSGNFNKSYKAIEKMGTDLNLTYPMGFAGSTSTEDREKMLPQLNKIMSFPTSIFIDKQGEVRKIHTGFNGPGTSVYEEFSMETNEFVMELLRE